MKLENLLKKIEVISNNRSYWLVRTVKGQLFDEYVNGNYISLGWDYLTLYQLENLSDDEIKNKIAINEGFDPLKTEDKIKITSSFNKLKTFLSLKRDDIVVIPGRNSDRIAFGRIIDDKAYEDRKEIEEGSFFKRRKVEWLEIKNLRELNPIFYQIKSNQHSISNIERFEPYINRVIENLYIKDNNTHFVLKIEKDDDVNFDDLTKLMDNIKQLVYTINNEFGLNEDLDNFYIKISLQSKGNIEFIKGGKSLAILGLILSITSCNTENNNSANSGDISIDNYISENSTIIDDTNKLLDSLDTNKEELAKITKYGK